MRAHNGIHVEHITPYSIQPNQISSATIPRSFPQSDNSGQISIVMCNRQKFCPPPPWKRGSSFLHYPMVPLRTRPFGNQPYILSILTVRLLLPCTNIYAYTTFFLAYIEVPYRSFDFLSIFPKIYLNPSFVYHASILTQYIIPASPCSTSAPFILTHAHFIRYDTFIDPLRQHILFPIEQHDPFIANHSPACIISNGSCSPQLISISPDFY